MPRSTRSNETYILRWRRSAGFGGHGLGLDRPMGCEMARAAPARPGDRRSSWSLVRTVIMPRPTLRPTPESRSAGCYAPGSVVMGQQTDRIGFALPRDALEDQRELNGSLPFGDHRRRLTGDREDVAATYLPLHFVSLVREASVRQLTKIALRITRSLPRPQQKGKAPPFGAGPAPAERLGTRQSLPFTGAQIFLLVK